MSDASVYDFLSEEDVNFIHFRFDIECDSSVDHGKKNFMIVCHEAWTIVN